jgi:hypothetical protein
MAGLYPADAPGSSLHTASLSVLRVACRGAGETAMDHWLLLLDDSRRAFSRGDE